MSSKGGQSMGMDLYNSLLAAKLADGGDFSPTQAQTAAMNSGITDDKLFTLETLSAELVDSGVKNLLDYSNIKTINTLFSWNNNVGTYNGVTVTLETDCIKISATNTSASVNIYICPESATWKNGKTYHIVGVPEASVDDISLNIQSGSPDYHTYYTKISNQEVTFPNVNTRIRFTIAGGATFAEVTIPLMMCSVAAYKASTAHQPFAMTNAELTAAVQALQAALAE